MKQSLVNLPIHIRQLPNSKVWFYDCRTQRKIHKDNIHKHLPKPAQDVLSKRWDLKTKDYE